MHSKIVEKFQKIADKSNAAITFSEAKDASYIDCVIECGSIDLYVGLVRGQQGDYYAHDITSSSLPREFYADSVSKNFTEEERSLEILKTIEDILDGNIEFYPSPDWSNKKRGYIILPVDGIERKLFQEQNSFKLPISHK
jgi:hypothetical protein